MDTKWSTPAYETAVTAGKEAGDPAARRRWAGQAEYDRDWMRTESTRFPLDLHRKLVKCCQEAGVSRYHLINYMLRVWMAAWEQYGRKPV